MRKNENTTIIQEKYGELRDYLDSLIVGENHAKDVIATALLCNKNSSILVSGKTGTGKSTLSDSLAKNFNSKKIQITADLLPSDILKLIADFPELEFLQLEEINRANGKVQSGLIELLGSNMITSEDGTIKFNDFYTFATQNDTEISGIFDTPLAIYDRFDLNIEFGNLTKEEIMEVLFEFRRKVKEADFNLREASTITSKIIDDFDYDDDDIEVLMQAIDYIRGAQHYNKDLFASSNIRGFKMMMRMAAFTSLADGKGWILPSHISDYISNLYLHRIDQSEMKMYSPEAKSALKKIEGKILSIERKGR